jgi:hypothetical protein
MQNLKRLAAAGVAAGLLGFAGSANALALKVSLNGTDQFEIFDNGVGDMSAIPNHIGIVGVEIGGAGSGIIIGATSTLSNAPGTTFASLGTNVHATTAAGVSGVNTIVFTASETGFTAPSADAAFSFINDFSLTSLDTSITHEIYIDFANTLYGAGLLVTSGTADDVLDDVLNSLLINESQTETPFSITHVITVSLDGPGQANATNDSTVEAPEPAALALLGLGLIGIATTRRRKA